VIVPLRMLPLLLRSALRARTRSALTVLGVALATFVAGLVGAMREGARRATEVDAADRTLIVYRENRFCPFTSRLPQSYQRRLEAVDGVEAAVPVRIVVSSCKAALDVVTFRGIPKDDLAAVLGGRAGLVDGSLEAWRGRADAALVGEALAARRGLRVGDRLHSAGIDVAVLGILGSADPQDRNTAFVSLPFLQEAAERGGTGGLVTRFDVRVEAGADLDAVAAAIDLEFAADPDPTSSSAEKAFVARAAGDVLAIVRFAGWLGLGALAAVLALCGNAIALAARDRARDHARMQVLGFRPALVARLVVGEALLLGGIGALLGTALALAAVAGGRLSLAAEGMNVEAVVDPGSTLLVLASAVALAILASLPPALRAARQDPVASLRELR
jgi:putative ABC transport system permease protein